MWTLTEVTTRCERQTLPMRKAVAGSEAGTPSLCQLHGQAARGIRWSSAMIARWRYAPLPAYCAQASLTRHLVSC
jgi:hypothetical protein